MSNTNAGEIFAQTIIELGKRVYQAEEDLRQFEYGNKQKDNEIDNLRIAEKKALENYWSTASRLKQLDETVIKNKHLIGELQAKIDNQAAIIRALEDDGKKILAERDNFKLLYESTRDRMDRAFMENAKLRRKIEKQKPKKQR